MVTLLDRWFVLIDSFFFFFSFFLVEAGNARRGREGVKAYGVMGAGSVQGERGCESEGEEEEDW